MRGKLLLTLCSIVALSGCAGVTPEAAPDPAPSAPAATSEAVASSFAEYSWDELSRISSEIAAAPDDEAGREVARSYGLVGDDGKLVRHTKQVVLDGHVAYDVRLVGLRHDDRADGSGKAGLTFLVVGALDRLPMNADNSIEGGWESSDLRAWLANDGLARFPEDLRSVIVPVSKLTNNAGLTRDAEDVTATSDALWVPSPIEVCGELRWDADEYNQQRGDSAEVDGLLNLEGAQYEAFAEDGVTCDGDPGDVLSLASSTGRMPWWYRTPYPFDWQGYGYTGTDGYFFQVSDSGFPKSLGESSVPAGVVVGFCV